MKARAVSTTLAALVLLAAPRSSRAQAGLLVPTSTGRPDAAVLALREMTVDVAIARGYARVNVRQVFENRTSSVQEGTYRFRLPPSASVSDFAVWDGLVRVPGVILEKRRARAIYRELTTQRIDPGPAAAGRGGRGRRLVLAAVRWRRVLRARVADPRLGHEARRAAVPAGGAARLGPRRVPPGAEARRGRAPVAGHLVVRVTRRGRGRAAGARRRCP